MRLAPVLFLLAACGEAPLPAPGLAPRAALPKQALDRASLPDLDPAEASLLVKFQDGARARLSRGRLAPAPGWRLDAAQALLDRAGAHLDRGVQTPDGELQALLDRAAERSGQAQPDLAGVVKVQVPGADLVALADLADALNALPEVEWVDLVGFVPPPGDISPTTGDYTALQDYFGPDPGFDVDAARADGLTGAGVRVTDIEYSYNAAHEDLVDIAFDLEAGQTARYTSSTYSEHGTATNGEIVAPDNGYGVEGMAHGATAAFNTEWSNESGSRRATAITNACAESAPGDVVMLEMQTYGRSRQYVPAEYDNAVWTATKVCTDAGVIVVAAAGNGAANLDSSGYLAYRTRGDSGAIIVGAGTAGSNGLHNRESYSTYGSRVNVQGWGSSVFTLGYGDYAAVGGDRNQYYTSAFSGTSSATPTVTGCVLLLQEKALRDFGMELTPANMRALLRDTGIPQTSGTLRPIGPQPDLGAALLALGADDDGDGFLAYLDDADDADPLSH